MQSKLIWRAVVLSWIAKLIGCGGMVVTHRATGSLSQIKGNGG